MGDAAQRYQIRLQKVTSYVVYSRLTADRYVGTMGQLQEVYRKVLVHNLLFGWWGFPAGLYWTPVALIRNRKAFGKLQALSLDPRPTQEAAPAPGAPNWPSEPASPNWPPAP